MMEEDGRGDISVEHIGRVEGQAHVHHSMMGRKSSQMYVHIMCVHFLVHY